MEPRHHRNCANNSCEQEADTSTQRETKRIAYTFEFTPSLSHTSWACSTRSSFLTRAFRLTSGKHTFVSFNSSLQGEVGETKMSTMSIHTERGKATLTEAPIRRRALQLRPSVGGAPPRQHHRPHSDHP